jgi:glutaminase
MIAVAGWKRGARPLLVVALVGVAAGCKTWGASKSDAPVSSGVSVTTLPATAQSQLVALADTDGTTVEARAGQAGNDAYRAAVGQAYKQFRRLKDGKNAVYIPVLARVDPELYGIALVTTAGAVYEVGSSRKEFSIQSVSKPFTLARVLEALGADAVRERVGVNATGQKFNSILAIELFQAQKRPAPGNPFVNAGAIATVDLLPAANANEKWEVILGMYNAFAGRKLTVNDEVYRSESETNTHNRAIVELLKDYEVVKGDTREALDLYTRQCSVNVSAHDLGVMGATLANGGRNPITGQQVVSAATASQVLAVMATAGLYDTTGEWLMATGVPAKSGVGGGIVAVMPGRFAIGTFAPPLDEAGNSVRGQKAIESIIQSTGGGVFASQPSGKAGATSAGLLPPASPGAAVAGKGN